MAKRRITKATIKRISLCRAGANAFPVLYKADDSSVEISLLTKATNTFDEQGELLAVVYAPEIRDSEGDIASASVIRDAMHEFAKSGEGVDICHEGAALPADKAYVAESFEIQKGDPRFLGFQDTAGAAVDVTGGWGIVMKIEDPELRTLYRSGEWNGVSMGGTGQVEVGKADDADINSIIRALARNMNLNISAFGSLDMDKTELEELLTKNNTALVAGIQQGFTESLVAAGLAKAQPPAVVPAVLAPAAIVPVAPEFKGPYTSANIAKHALDVEAFNAQKDVNWANPEDITKLQTTMAGIEKRRTELEGKKVEDADKSPELLKAEKELATATANIAKLAKGSNQTPGADAGDDSEAIRLHKCGLSMAAHVNKRSGYATAPAA